MPPRVPGTTRGTSLAEQSPGPRLQRWNGQAHGFTHRTPALDTISPAQAATRLFEPRPDPVPGASPSGPQTWLSSSSPDRALPDSPAPPCGLGPRPEGPDPLCPQEVLGPPGLLAGAPQGLCPGLQPEGGTDLVLQAEPFTPAAPPPASQELPVGAQTPSPQLTPHSSCSSGLGPPREGVLPRTLLGGLCHPGTPRRPAHP